jgi:intein/homing endonuclease
MRKYLNKKYNNYLYSVRFSNKKIHHYLGTLGIVPRKSKIIELKIPLNKHILRGIFDGDGCVRTTNLKSKNPGINVTIVSGSKKLFLQLKKYLNTFIHTTY